MHTITPRAGDIGVPERTIETPEPLPEREPITVPQTVPADPDKVPA